MDIYVYKYNNYYNRILKRESTLEDYGEPIYIEENVQSFNPNDGVNTSLLLGSSIASYDGTGDYILVVDNGEILSRWFIIETHFETSKIQWKLMLRRDLLVEFYNEIVESNCFIDKATLLSNDYLIYNVEDISVNQIKQKEYLLKDETQCQWLVGYVARQQSVEGGNPFPLSAKIKYNLDINPDYEIASESDKSSLPFFKYLDRESSYAGDFAIDIFFKGGSSEVTFNSINRFGPTTCPAKLKINSVESGYGWVTGSSSSSSVFDYGFENYNYIYGYLNKTPATTAYNTKVGYHNRHFATYLYNAISDSSWQTITTAINAAAGNISAAEIGQYVNKVVKIGDKKYITKLEETFSSTTSTPLSASIPNVELAMRQYYNQAIVAYAKDYPNLTLPAVAATPSSSASQLIGVRAGTSGKAKLVLEELTDTKITASISTDTLATRCADAPYDIITMPYSDTLQIKTSEGTYTANKDLALATMTALIGQNDSIADVQLLPYCPLREFIDLDGNIDLTLKEDTTFSTDVYYVLADTTQVRVTPLIYCSKSSNSFDIPFVIKTKDPKIESICDMWRLCSPNYAALFEFNVAKNGGIQYFNVDYNYRPYSPYIHINPNFGKLYGQDFNDPRGLICAGDFSITTTRSAWETYELQNKNYEKSFQRQIQNMEKQHSAQSRLEGWQAVTGTLQGIAAGGYLGSAAGPVGGIIGGAIGGTASLIGGLADISINRELRAEALDYTKDMFGYQLDNIKALPTTIAKVTTINRNNKGFPVLEYYTCTDREKKAVAQKIAYNGMTVKVIDKPINYIGNYWSYTFEDGTKIETKGYIKGSIIHLNNLEDDFHLLKSISDEFYKGVYIQ